MHCTFFPPCAQIYIYIYNHCSSESDIIYVDIHLYMGSSHLRFELGIGVENFLVVPGKGFHRLFGTLARHRRHLATGICQDTHKMIKILQSNAMKNQTE